MNQSSIFSLFLFTYCTPFSEDDYDEEEFDDKTERSRKILNKKELIEIALSYGEYVHEVSIIVVDLVYRRQLTASLNFCLISLLEMKMKMKMKRQHNHLVKEDKRYTLTIF